MLENEHDDDDEFLRLNALNTLEFFSVPFNEKIDAFSVNLKYNLTDLM